MYFLRRWRYLILIRQKVRVAGHENHKQNRQVQTYQTHDKESIRSEPPLLSLHVQFYLDLSGIVK